LKSTKRNGNVIAYVGIVFTLLVVAALILSGDYLSYYDPRILAWQSLSGGLRIFFIFFAVVSLLIATYMRGAKKRQLAQAAARKEHPAEHQQRDAYLEDKHTRMVWGAQVVDFLWQEENRSKTFTGIDLVAALQDTEEITGLTASEKERWMDFLRNRAGYQNGLRFYIQGIPCIRIERILPVDDSAWLEEKKRKTEAEDGYLYSYQRQDMIRT